MLVTDVNLGLNISHAARGQIQVTLKAPDDSTATTIVSTINDNNDNYDLLIADGSTNNINDGSNDSTGTPYYEADRRAGPRPDGSLDSFDGKNSLGTWTVYICDGSNGTTGTLNRLRLALLGNYNRAPLASLGLSGPVNIDVSTLDLSGSITDNPVAVQFIHRGLAYLIAILILAWWSKALKTTATPLFRNTRTWPPMLVGTQVLLGIFTVLYSPDKQALLWLGVAHQFVAMLLLLSLVWTLRIMK
jgi:subtilisin-like proprotein convertase family protein